MPIDLVVDDKEGGSRSDGEEFTRTPGGAEQASLHLYISIFIYLYVFMASLKYACWEPENTFYGDQAV